ncbi:MAG TPA: NUDIX domain-containing protein [Candidatus Saccharimonadales bacterium]|nr:NUDIX domain-containing protein [Candidatus Saccharimonadales bacterium]
MNESGEVVTTLSREEAEKLNHLTQNVLVFLFDSDGRVWIQKRPMNKKHFPSLWDISACGGVSSGEDLTKAVKREVLEETGLETKLIYVESFLNEFPGHNDQTFRRLSHLYIGITNEIPKENREVDEFRAYHYKKLAANVAKSPSKYVPSFLLELNKAVKAYKKQKDI